ncbi:sialate O-acetylesterase [Kinneretia aquatilis]|uniref:sialate O-acetylesterase n=1 Tax=Kinneretia aquatilis TaxID=2070761 RepID=UPI0014953729|nr:sialate O-acetylesterase [Paucibacter aquatile]WIV95798.1 sialate O-acetylesterase [Paucibacter aquatile]
MAAHAELRLHGVFGDHMVLQRAVPIPVWGQAEPGERVELRLHGQRKTVQADAQGRWRLQLRPEAAGGPYRLELRGERSDQVLALRDVLVGDVWLASGQSNMEWALRDSFGGSAEAAAAQDPGLRHLKIAHRTATQPQSDLAPAPWQAATGLQAADFSAVAYHFARQLRQKQPGVPIGLLNASWGGTQIESWMSREALARQPDIAPLLAGMPDSPQAFAARYRARMDALLTAWQGRGAGEPGQALAHWGRADWDDSRWPQLQAPGLWEGQGLSDLDGTVWYRRSLQLSEAQAAAPDAVLNLGLVDDCDESFVNGQSVGGQCGWDQPRRYALAPGLLRAGLNVIAVRVRDTGGGGGLHGRPEGLALQLGGQTLSLAGPWRAQVESVLVKPELGPNDLPSLLFNGMLSPLQGLPIRGMLWYQGESNVPRAAQYERLLPAFISDLRARWGQGEFSFFIVQLAADQPWQSNSLQGSAWAELREAQARALRLPRTGLVLSSDLTDDGNLHPRHKRELGERLAALALEDAKSAKNLKPSAKPNGKPKAKLNPQVHGRVHGPLLQRMRIRGPAVELSFTQTAGGLYCPDAEIRGFTVAGADGVFHPAHAQLIGKHRVRVSSPAVPQPQALRYGWLDNPQPINLFNRAGQPAMAFRSDRWPRLTETQSYGF